MNQENQEVIKYIARKRRLYCQAMRYLKGYDGADYSPVAEVEREMAREENDSIMYARYKKLLEALDDVLPIDVKEKIISKVRDYE